MLQKAFGYASAFLVRWAVYFFWNSCTFSNAVISLVLFRLGMSAMLTQIMCKNTEDTGIPTKLFSAIHTTTLMMKRRT